MSYGGAFKNASPPAVQQGPPLAPVK
jgi:hypothetical protein